MANYNINIFGSTGEIGNKTLNILRKYYSSIKINLLVSNQNYKKLIKQTNYFTPKYICIINHKHIPYIKENINLKKTKVIHPNDLNNFLNNSYSDLTILSIAGYNALNYFLSIIKNTKLLGLVNKECIVSAGHLFNKLTKKYKTIIFPIDSEHNSLFQYFDKSNIKNYKDIKKIFLTASGGPFYGKKNNNNSFTLSKALNHPKWKMGYKNSIDSATLMNKCLEIVEAHYLFKIPYNKLNIIIHPESLIHSIIEYENYTSTMNYFYHDMFIPIFNFVNFFTPSNKKENINKNFLIDFKNDMKLNFHEVSLNRYPIYKIFQNLDKSDTSNLIKFNCANEYAVDLFKSGVIKFNEISESIQFFLSLEFNYPVNSINSIIEFQKKYVKKIKSINLDL